MSDWQPIETAPKDKELILNFCGKVMVGWWDEQQFNKTPRPYWRGDKEYMGVYWFRVHQPYRMATSTITTTTIKTPRICGAISLDHIPLHYVL